MAFISLNQLIFRLFRLVSRTLFADVLPQAKGGLSVEYIGILFIASAIAFKIVLYPNRSFFLDVPPDVSLWSIGVMLAINAVDHLSGSKSDTSFLNAQIGPAGTFSYRIPLPSGKPGPSRISPGLAGLIICILLWFGSIILSSQASRFGTSQDVWTNTASEYFGLSCFLSATSLGIAINHMRDVS